MSDFYSPDDKRPYYNKRPKCEPKGRKITFSLDEIYKHFTDSVTEVTSYSTLSESIKDDRVLADNLLRSQIVMLCSSFDFYMHELIKVIMRYMFKGKWEKTGDYIELVGKMNEDVTEEKIIEAANKKFNKDSFYNKWPVSNCLFTMLGFKKDEVIKNSNLVRGITTEYNFNKALQDFAERRNDIAHQYDRNLLTADIVPIDGTTVKKALDDIVKIVTSINTVANNTRA